jgi:adenylate kinase family enzyme
MVFRSNYASLLRSDFQFLSHLQLSEIVNKGQLVSDEIIMNLLSKRLADGQAKGESGFILDGFPRTIKQAVSIFVLNCC